MWAEKTKIHAIDLTGENDKKSKDKKGIAEPIINDEIKKSIDTEDFRVSKKKSGCTAALFSGFADDFGIVGVKYVVGKSVAVLRRLLWLLVLLSGMSVMSYQIWERIAYFVSYPFNVNIQLDYVEELTFPAVAICNFNRFRKDATDATNYTDLIYGMYGTYSPDFSGYDLEFTASEEFYKLAAHQPETMLLMPTWKSVYISQDSFKTIITDFGVCYAFNTGEDEFGVRTSDNAGKSYGFSIILDASQWNYNIGPQIGVGFQVMLYKQGDVPLVGEMGFAVPVGEEVRVGVEVTNITNLPPPHGVCRDKELTYYSRYSKNACRLECFTEFILRTCGCRLAYMPGNATVCDISQAYGCGNWALSLFVNQSSQCDCPVPCSRVMYRPNLSHAKFPSDIYSSFLSSLFGMPSSTFSGNIAKLDIFFQELSVTQIEQQEAYDIFGLLCDIGGALGLWLGGSILTVIEIFDIIMKGCFTRGWH
ncbi:acid-sensing ion channel 1C-like [Ptychodera flava]|uniref:acid-sensing ion channel 1C-like n=1 Tax=Ptychodera flava TaxID=63121 RepID=UPI003969CAE2